MKPSRRRFVLLPLAALSMAASVGCTDHREHRELARIEKRLTAAMSPEVHSDHTSVLEVGCEWSRSMSLSGFASLDDFVAHRSRSTVRYGDAGYDEAIAVEANLMATGRLVSIRGGTKVRTISRNESEGWLRIQHEKRSLYVEYLPPVNVSLPFDDSSR